MNSTSLNHNKILFRLINQDKSKIQNSIEEQESNLKNEIDSFKSTHFHIIRKYTFIDDILNFSN